MPSTKQDSSSDTYPWNGSSEPARLATVLLSLGFIYLTWPEGALFFAGGVLVLLIWCWWKRRQQRELSLSDLLAGRSPVGPSPDTDGVEIWTAAAAGALAIAVSCASEAIRGEGVEYWLCIGAAGL